MKRLLASVASATLFVACSSSPAHNPIEKLRTESMDTVLAYSIATGIYLKANSESSAIEKAMAATAGILKDPESARFRNLRVSSYEKGAVICGEVNGKNSYGGYTGYQPFVASMDAATLYDGDKRYLDIYYAANAGLFAACK